MTSGFGRLAIARRGKFFLKFQLLMAGARLGGTSSTAG
jgi:hypothetical protein